MEWRTIPGFSNYEASERGDVRRAKAGPGAIAGRVMKPRKHKSGYLVIGIPNDEGKQVNLSVHVAVCSAFHGARPGADHEAAHGDGIRHHNSKDNLRWATKEDNWADRYVHGTDVSGEKNPRNKLTASQVERIRGELRCGSNHRPYKVIAAEFGISVGMVGHIRHGRAWSDTLTASEIERVYGK